MLMAKNITQEYLSKRIIPDGKQESNKEYYFKDGVKTLKDGHWEYLYDDSPKACSKIYSLLLLEGFYL